WAIRLLPLLEKIFRKHKHPVGGSWRIDETYIKVKGAWKYLYRAVKRITKPMLGFKSFRSAKSILVGIELMHMIRKGQLMMEGADDLSFADQFYALAGKIRSV
ncbi:DDE-type integrase/transposase/recombinase, partial [Undibacterium sp. RTI2.1]|uniref:DDE-type integrase/transposase/recombinase n=1 Tax=unclassified Undibacterium TaxID=2630295 RepID=UPI002B222828